MNTNITEYPFFKEAEKVGSLFIPDMSRQGIDDEIANLSKYAVVLREGKAAYGFIEIPEDGDVSVPAAKIAMWTGVLPPEMDVIAKGIVNTIFMAKEGVELPLFSGYPDLDDNTINISDIDWRAYAESHDNVDKIGFEYNGTFLPLDTRANVKAAAEMFDRYASVFDGRSRVIFATKIAKQADRFAIDPGKTVEKYASGQLNTEFYDLMDIRLSAAEGYPETRAAIETLVQEVPAMEVDKVAEVLGVIDQMPPFHLKFAQAHTLGSGTPMFSTAFHILDAYESVYGKVIIPQSFEEKVAGLSEENLLERFSSVFVERLMESPHEALKLASAQVTSTLREMTTDVQD